MPEYADLEIALRRHGDDAYAVEFRFLSPTSEAEEHWNEGAIATIDVDQLRAESGDDWVDYGKKLRDAFFTGEIRERFLGLRARCADLILRVRLVIDRSAKELHEVAWEAMWDLNANADAPLFAGPKIAFSRYLSSNDWRSIRTRRKTELKALFAVANPADLAEYKSRNTGLPLFEPIAEADITAARNSLQGPIAVTEFTGKGEATLKRIAKELTRNYDVLYLMCHGTIKVLEGGAREAKLFLVDGDGNCDVVSAIDLIRQIEHLPERPRMIVLASCQSAGTGADALETDPSALASALGPRLAEAGVPAVIAMRGNVNMATAAKFLSTFFAHLHADGQIDRAMSEARFEVQDEPDFWVPVLYTRLKSGRIWYVPGFGKARDFSDQWKTLCGFVQEGNFVPILGPELSARVCGDQTEMAQTFANEFAYPMSVNDHSDVARVAQFIEHNVLDGKATLLKAVQKHWGVEAVRRFPEVFETLGPDDDPMDAVVKKMLEDEDNPFTILASLDTASLYVNASADTLMERALKLYKQPRVPKPVATQWRDERREDAPNGEVVQKEIKGDPRQPVLYYVFGTCKAEQSDTWVLTEDDYFDYLIKMHKHSLMPTDIGSRLNFHSLMFLGFHLDDWKSRVLLRMIRAQGGSAALERLKHVGVQVSPDEMSLSDANRTKKFLEKYFADSTWVQLYWVSAADFLKELRTQLAIHKSTVAPKVARAIRGFGG